MNDKIILDNIITATSKYRGSSKFSFWKNIKPGDKIHISINLADPGRGRSLYATEVNFRVNDTAFTCSITQAGNYLNNIDYELEESKSN